MKKIYFPVIALIVVLLGGCGSTSSDLKSDDEQETVSVTNDNEGFSDVVESDALRDDILKACALIGVDTDAIELEKTDNWAGGERYSFIYKGAPFYIYCNGDEYVENINIGTQNGTSLYLYGYEPYSVSDYIVPEEDKDWLIEMAKDLTIQYLNFPSTADYALLDWGFARDHELYYVSSTVTAANGFGVEDDVPFIVGVRKDSEGNITPFAVEMNANVVWSQDSGYVAPERQVVEIESSTGDELISADGILIEDGVQGEYGEEVTVSGETYYHYAIPAGTYTVENLNQYGTIFVVGDGSADDVRSSYQFSSEGETAEVTIEDGTHLETSMYTKVILREK